MRFGYLIFGLMLFVGVQARSAILIEEGGKSVSRQSVRYGSIATGLSFRETHRVGVGVGAAGAHGMAGVDFELNFTGDMSFVGGFGLGSGFQTFRMQIKKMIAGNSFLPYIAGGFARWYSVGDPENRQKTNPSFLAKRFLNDEEKSSGEFAESLIYPSLGIQYTQLGGEYAGVSLYAEIMLFIDIEDFVTAPTGGLGMMYYF